MKAKFSRAFRIILQTGLEVAVIFTVTLGMAYWVLIWPQRKSFPISTLGVEQTCGLVKEGMTLREAVTAIETKTVPEFEGWDGISKLSVGWHTDDSFCQVEFKNGSVVSTNVIRADYLGQ